MKLLTIMLLGAQLSFATIELTASFIRQVPKSAKMSSAYLKISNSGDKEITLVDVKSSITEKIEIHNHIMQDGMMKMVKLDGLKILPGQSVELKPHSYHLMLFGLQKPLEENTKETFTLIFDNGEKKTLVLPVKKK